MGRVEWSSAAGAALPRQILRELDEIRAELPATPSMRWLRAVSDVHDATERLRVVDDPGRLLAEAVNEIHRSCGLDRGVIARTSASEWMAVGACFRDDPIAARTLMHEIAEQRMGLDRLPFESEILRRRAGVLLDGDAATPSALRAVDSRLLGAHVVGPVVVGGQVIALVYAGSTRRVPDTLDRDIVSWFARGIADLYERAVLSARLRAQRARVRELERSTQTALADICAADIELRVRGRGDARRTGAGSAVLAAPEQPLEALLTRRELQVLALMAAGVNNRGIAERFVLAEATVKSHVKRILRKLGATNRAEAVARYLHQCLGDRA